MGDGVFLALGPETLGFGVDLVARPRFARFLGRPAGDLGAVFTAAELQAAGSGTRRELYLATRWALKEAALKALGTGWSAGVEWTDVEATGALRAPHFLLRGRAEQRARRLGARRVLGAVAWAGALVIAVVALTGGPNAAASEETSALPPR
jgi:holo-[acyl-carrier protein] synthase